MQSLNDIYNAMLQPESMSDKTDEQLKEIIKLDTRTGNSSFELDVLNQYIENGLSDVRDIAYFHCVPSMFSRDSSNSKARMTAESINKGDSILIYAAIGPQYRSIVGGHYGNGDGFVTYDLGVPEKDFTRPLRAALALAERKLEKTPLLEFANEVLETASTALAPVVLFPLMEKLIDLNTVKLLVNTMSSLKDNMFASVTGRLEGIANEIKTALESKDVAHLKEMYLAVERLPVFLEKIERFHGKDHQPLVYQILRVEEAVRDLKIASK
jgi:hypothetical protein